MGVNIWNSIEVETRYCKNLELFKVKYKSLLSSIYLIRRYLFVIIWWVYMYMATNE